MKKIVKMKFGSHLYGLNTPSSDTDYKGIYVPEVKDLILGTAAHSIEKSTGDMFSKNKSSDVDYDIYSIQKFVRDLASGQTYAIDMVHCEDPIITSTIWEYIVDNRKMFYTRNMKAYIGYVKQQAAKYGVKGSRLSDIKNAITSILVEGGRDVETIGDISDKLFIGEFAKIVKIKNKKTQLEEQYYEVNGKCYQFSNSCEYVADRLQLMYDSYGSRAKLAEKNEGIDWKAISHALRAGYQALHIYQDGDFKYPLDENSFIMDVKQGKLDFKADVSPKLESLVDSVIELADNATHLPNKVSTNFTDSIILKAYGMDK